MISRTIKFLVIPGSLLDEIQKVSAASIEFSRNWIAEDFDNAGTISQEAFVLLEHIQGELMRHRDTMKSGSAYSASRFKAALDVEVGDLLEPATPANKLEFQGLSLGHGAMPVGMTFTKLTLEKALNKLKHRDTNLVNFTVSDDGDHTLFIFTKAGMGCPDSLSSFNVRKFCDSCKAAADVIR